MTVDGNDDDDGTLWTGAADARAPRAERATVLIIWDQKWAPRRLKHARARAGGGGGGASAYLRV